MTVRDFSLMDMIERNACVFPTREAIVHGSSRMTFSEYQAACRRLWSGFYSAGARPGDRVALVARNSLDYLTLCGAAALGGLVVVPVNWRLNPEELQFLLGDASPHFLVTSTELQEGVEQAEQGLASLKARYVLGPDPRGRYRPLAELHRRGERAGTAEAGVPYAIIYTAAVEGRAKGAVLTQANLMALMVSLGSFFKLNVEDAHCCFLPLFHIAGLSLSMAVMQAGGKNIIQEKFDADETLDLIERESASILYSFPPMLDQLFDRQSEKERNLASLKYIGGLNPPDSMARFQKVAPHVRFAVMFGQTEAMAVTAGWADEAPGSTGRAAPLARVRIVDEADRDAAVGEVGEICVKSPCVFQGYRGYEDETAWVLRNGWHHTGDMGWLDERGHLWYAGRMPAKELIKTGGENVYPAEVERALLEHHSVVEVCVIGVPDEHWGEAVKAVCVFADGDAPAEEELIAFVGTSLAGYKKPRHIVKVNSLPKTAEGMIDRGAVKRHHG
jgi:long-chain acyl-CoA synthetase